MISGYEDVHGTFNGVHYGPNMLLLARSPDWLLAWSPGHPYWSGRMQNYGTATLYLINRKDQHSFAQYERLFDGGRLSAARLREVREKIDQAFGEGVTESLIERRPAKARSTLLVAGGGDPLSVSHRQMKRKREAENPQPKLPKVEQMGWTEDQVDRLMDACRERLEGANDEEGQRLWRKLQALKDRFQPRRRSPR